MYEPVVPEYFYIYIYFVTGPISAVIYASKREQSNATAMIAQWLLKAKRKDNIAIHFVTTIGVKKKNK